VVKIEHNAKTVLFPDHVHSVLNSLRSMEIAPELAMVRALHNTDWDHDHPYLVTKVSNPDQRALKHPCGHCVSARLSANG